MSDFKEVASGSKILVSVSGYSGIGKTSLVNQLQEESSSDQRYVSARGSLTSITPTYPYFAFFEAIKQFCSMIFMEPEESIGKWKQTLSEHLGDDAALLTGKVAELALLTGRSANP